MARASFDKIRKAEKAQGGGKYRLIAQRLINGHKCRCYAYVVMVGAVAYWNVEYVVDGKHSCPYSNLIEAMYEIAQAKADDLCSKGQKTIMWTY